MRIVIAGGHGKIALLLERQLADAGHTPIGIVRNPDHVADLEAAGAEAVVLDLEQTDVDTLSKALVDADAVVFAAGGGPSSGAGRKLTVDRDAAILLADAAELMKVRRYVMISAMGADRFDPGSEEVFQVYLKAKADADADIRQRGALDWTVVRPGGLTDDPPTGLVQIGAEVPRGTVPRADVAAVVVHLLTDDDAEESAGRQFELVSGRTPIAEIDPGAQSLPPSTSS